MKRNTKSNRGADGCLAIPYANDLGGEVTHGAAPIGQWDNPRFDVTSHVERWCPNTNGCGDYEPPVGLTVEESQPQGITLEAYGRLEDEENETHRRVRTVLGASEARELASVLLAAAEKLEKYADAHPRQIGGTVLLGGAS